jgi:cation/acetate symporter
LFIYTIFAVLLLSTIGTVGMVINFIITYIVFRLTPPPPLAVQQLVENLRSPEGEIIPLSDIGEEQLD